MVLVFFCLGKMRSKGRYCLAWCIYPWLMLCCVSGKEMKEKWKEAESCMVHVPLYLSVPKEETQKEEEEIVLLDPYIH